MKPSRQRRIVLQTGLAFGLGLAGLPARSCEFFSSNLRVIHPWTRASGDADDSAIVSMGFDQVQQDDRLIGVETAVAAGAEIVEQDGSGALRTTSGVDFFIPQGRDSQLAEGGTFLRLTGLQMPLDVGRTYPMRLHFQTGGTLRASLSVDMLRFR